MRAPKPCKAKSYISRNQPKTKCVVCKSDAEFRDFRCKKCSKKFVEEMKP